MTRKQWDEVKRTVKEDGIVAFSLETGEIAKDRDRAGEYGDYFNREIYERYNGSYQFLIRKSWDFHKVCVRRSLDAFAPLVLDD